MSQLKASAIAVLSLFVFQDLAFGALSIDASVAGSERTGLSNGSTFTSNAFSTTSPNQLILALVQGNTASTGAVVTISGITGAGLTWVLVRRQNANNGTAEIWRAFATSTITSQTLTATFAINTGGSSHTALMSIISFSGADPSGTNGSGAIGATAASGSASGTPSASLTTTRNGSWVVGSLFNWTNSTAPTVPADQTAFGNLAVTGGGRYWSQRKNASTPSSGTSVTINVTAPTGIDYAEAICEVLESPASPAGFSIIQ
ncbi:MAG: hypothetical protein K2X47_14415 [Bdellovibrionales bacterium]|nr:hypothetical protein [Bdellovibrionales bacterium]